jgi:hypothetical protein
MGLRSIPAPQINNNNNKRGDMKQINDLTGKSKHHFRNTEAANGKMAIQT